MPFCCFELISKRGYVAAIVSAFAVDFIVCCAAWVTGQHSVQEAADTNRYAGATTDTVDCCIVRIICFPVFATLAFMVHQRGASHSPINRLKREDAAAAAAAGAAAAAVAAAAGSRAEGSAVMMAPLMDSPNGSPEVGTSTANGSSVNGSSISPAMSAFEMKQEHTLCMKKAEKRRNLVMGLLFLMTTGMSMYNGLKCVNFHYEESLVMLQGMLLASTIFFINCEFFLLLDLLNKLTEEEGELIPSMHMHPLFFETDLKCHVCDICHESMRGPHYVAYRCRTCDFDLCPRCYKKKDKPTAKGFGARAIRRDGEQLTTWTYFKRIIQLSLDFKYILASALVCLVCTQALIIWAPHIQGSIFDGIFFSLQNPGNPAGRDAFQRACLTYLAVSASQGFFGGLKSLFQDLALRQLACSCRSKLFTSVIRMDIAFFDSMHTGQLTSRLTNDASQMVQPLSTLMNDLVANLISLTGGMCMAFYTSWKLSVLALTIVPPITFTYRKYAHWARMMNRSIWCAYGEANSTATEAIHNIRTVRGFSTEHIEAGKYNDSINTALKHGKMCAYIGASTTAFSQYLTLGTSVLILWYGGTLVCDSQGKAMSIGNVMTFNLYWNMMNTAFISLGNVFNELIRSSSAAERVCSLIDARPERDPEAGISVQRDQLQGQLELQSVQFRYQMRPENLVLKGISLTMKPGTTTALVGKSGGGKSTLVHLLMRFYEPTEGSIRLDGEDVTTFSSISVRQCCGFVAQDTQLFATSVEENLAYGLGRPYTQEELIAACRAANAHEFIMETEDQYQTRVGEKGVLLSGGQRQRLAIARCFLRRPRLLFLDEATSALDAENEGIVQEALETLIEQLHCTVVLIAHRLSTVINADQIAVIHKGAIVELGPHQALIEKGGIYAQLVKRQMARDVSAVTADDKAGEAGGKGKGKSKGRSKGPGNVQTEIDELIDEMEKSGGLAMLEASGVDNESR